MSVPAPEVRRGDEPVARPSRPRPVPRRVPAARPPIPNPLHPHRRARREPHRAFWILSLTVIAAMAVGLVSLNAMRVDATYEAHVVTQKVRLLSDEQETLVNEVARLSSPSRIGSWARARGLVHPAAGDVVILQVPGTGGSTGDLPRDPAEAGA